MKALFFGKGRINRITFVLGVAAIGLLGFLYTQVVSGRTYSYADGGILVLLPLVLLAYFAVRLCILRLHDADQSVGWTVILLVLPIAPLVMLIFALLPGTKGVNDGGPQPRSGVSISS